MQHNILAVQLCYLQAKCSGRRRNQSENAGMEMTAGIMVLLADLWAITRTLRSDAEPKNKAMWVAIALLLPFVGMVLWILYGPS
jgi:zinc transporter ZupT